MAKAPAAALLLFLPLSASPLAPFFSPPTLITATIADSSNNLYIAGATTQGNLPVSAGVVQPSLPPCASPGCQHGFLAKISPNGGLSFATYLSDPIVAIALDATGNIYVATDSGILELSSDGTGILASKQFSDVHIFSIAVARDVFAVGTAATGGGFSATAGAFQTTGRGSGDGFVIRLRSEER